MKSQSDDPFGTIESAHDFMMLLAAAVSQAKEDLQMDVDRETASDDLSRRVDALRMALYNVEKLEVHLNRSSRILNDLRTLRRLLFEEREVAGRAERRAVTSAEKSAAA
ncbi:MAG TPA: hypothetical protein VGS27_12320 [Candidatus Sulfotelmatobacter sp.]|nr:hypothetical protein [Candidatus Sulfotelmatobacter sp.]